ncbi:chitinase, partial [Streptomyces decoyicus]
MSTLVRSRVRMAALALSAVVALAFGATATTGATAAPAPVKQGPTSVAYVEVNNNSMLNVGKYTLANGGGNLLDVAGIVAADKNKHAGPKAAPLDFKQNQ